MNGVALLVLIVEVSSIVVGQIFLKHALEQGKKRGFGEPRVIVLFAAGIGGLTISFFLTIALLQHFALSYFFPFQASVTILIVLAAALFLRERLSLRLIVGTLLIFVGIVLVSAS